MLNFFFSKQLKKKPKTQNNAQPPKKKTIKIKKFVCLQLEKLKTNFFKNIKNPKSFIKLKKKSVGFGFEFRRWRGSFRFHNKWRVVLDWLVKIIINLFLISL